MAFDVLTDLDSLAHGEPRMLRTRRCDIEKPLERPSHTSTEKLKSEEEGDS